jgi:phosphocarrier protein HPr
MALVERRVEIVNQLGLHARPAAAFVTLAAKFASEILVIKDDMPVNGKSILGMMTLAAEQGCCLIIRAEGLDAEDAVAALQSLVQKGFDE